MYYLLRSPATLTQLLIHLYDQSAPSLGSILSAYLLLDACIFTQFADQVKHFLDFLGLLPFVS